MKNILIIAFFWTQAFNVFAQETNTIKESAMVTANAMMKGDYAVLVDYSYPKLINIFGGKQAYIKVIKEQMAELLAQGITFSKVVIGEPGEIYHSGKELHCLVPEKLTLKTNKGYLVSLSYLLAVSPDNGKKWYFIDTAVGEKLKELFPDFNKNLVIPQPTQPTLYRDSI